MKKGNKILTITCCTS